ncbi:MAG: hypothetical protein ACTSQ7_10480 [Alphaproteobacteria bacterium]
MEQRFNVKEGQRYAQRRSVQQHASIWKVGAILATDPSIPHVRLINVADPLQTKTISCFTLRDRLYFELVAETATGMG